MSYLSDIALAIEAEIPRELLPPGDTRALMVMYAVLVRAKRTDVTAEDVHDAWAAWRSLTDPDHRSIRPFEDLAADVQDQDGPFVAALRRVAARLTAPRRDVA